MNKEDVDNLIEKLGGKTSACDCSGYPCHEDYCSVKGKSVMMTDVLDGMKPLWDNYVELLDLWGRCGHFTNSLQQIAEEGWEDNHTGCPAPVPQLKLAPLALFKFIKEVKL